MSIEIDNFSISLGEVTYCTSLVDFSVDVTDSVYNVTASGIYYIYNDTVTSGSLTPITNGYRLTYTTTPSGNIDLVVRASNDNAEVYEKTYQFYYGYECVWNSVNYWGNSKTVPVSVTATNMSLKDNTAHFSTFFETRKIDQVNLGASIAADGSGKQELGAAIAPQSKYFMNGKTYTFIISGIKDFSGNALPSRVYTFTIEEEDE